MKTDLRNEMNPKNDSPQTTTIEIKLPTDFLIQVLELCRENKMEIEEFLIAKLLGAESLIILN